MCAVDDKRPVRRNNNSSSGNEFIITAAEGSPEYRRKERKDLPTPTEHGYPNDSILHGIYSPAAYKRNY